MTPVRWVLLGGAAIAAYFLLSPPASASVSTTIATADKLINLAHGAGATDSAAVRGWQSGSTAVPPPNTGGTVFQARHIAGSAPAAADAHIPMPSTGPAVESRRGAAHF
jgi:hypothetical protein